MKQFFKIIDYKDSRDHIKLLEKKQHDYMAAAAKRKKKILLISGAALCAVIAVILVVTLVIIPAGKYDKAMALMEDGKYQEAYVQFMECGTYKDASEKMAEIRQSMLRRQTIVAGVNHTVGLKSDGTVVAVGSNLYHQCEVDDWADIVEITAGDYYTVGLKSDGTVVVAGDKNDNNFSGIENWTDIRLPE